MLIDEETHGIFVHTSRHISAQSKDLSSISSLIEAHTLWSGKPQMQLADIQADCPINHQNYHFTYLLRIIFYLIIFMYVTHSCHYHLPALSYLLHTTTKLIYSPKYLHSIFMCLCFFFNGILLIYLLGQEKLISEYITENTGFFYFISAALYCFPGKGGTHDPLPPKCLLA